MTRNFNSVHLRLVIRLSNMLNFVFEVYVSYEHPCFYVCVFVSVYVASMCRNESADTCYET